ncbi:hypothetical protein GCM10023225_10020 [Kineococcus glutinatus]|uniref:Phosphotyrosine protein phosphatase I domain-containing protein n=1 Tax=Kineococcus glutinatus TaxID=1070872 RepID=A0ABP9HFW0_9ACTN
MEVTSAGTRALPGLPVDPVAAELLEEATGRPPGPSTARLLDARLVEDADLVVGMTREHRRAVLELVPAAQRRTFTLRELARIARELHRTGRVRGTADPAAALRALLAAAPPLRGPTAPADPAGDDEPDVHGLPAQEQRRTGRRLGTALDEVLAALAPDPARAVPQALTRGGSGSADASGW